MIARDLARAVDAGAPPTSLADDAHLLRSEVERCRAILDRMSGRAEQLSRESLEPLFAKDVAALFGADELGDSAKRVTVELDAPPDARLGARSDFHAVVLPLVRNSLDASRPESAVRVRVEVTLGRICVTVRDEGHGMSPEVLERAGEPFFTTRPPGRGTGLGLFVVRLHAERLGGTLSLDSAPERGTTARAAWPVTHGE